MNRMNTTLKNNKHRIIQRTVHGVPITRLWTINNTKSKYNGSSRSIPMSPVRIVISPGSVKRKYKRRATRRQVKRGGSCKENCIDMH